MDLGCDSTLKSLILTILLQPAFRTLGHLLSVSYINAKKLFKKDKITIYYSYVQYISSQTEEIFEVV